MALWGEIFIAPLWEATIAGQETTQIRRADGKEEEMGGKGKRAGSGKRKWAGKGNGRGAGRGNGREREMGGKSAFKREL
jgi:hypothetical protein